jgi:hypothetical protein
VAGSVGVNEASTTLLLIDNRSGVQISAAEGTAKNFDFGIFGAAFAGIWRRWRWLLEHAARQGGGGGLRRLLQPDGQGAAQLQGADRQGRPGHRRAPGRAGGQTPASQQVQQAPAPAATPAASTRSTTQPKPKAPKKPAAKDPNAQGK